MKRSKHIEERKVTMLDWELAKSYTPNESCYLGELHSFLHFCEEEETEDDTVQNGTEQAEHSDDYDMFLSFCERDDF